jgi:phosphoribosylglycinamide formyltransferase-1
MTRLGILGSTRGTHLDAIIQAIRDQRIAASIEIVASNKPASGILERARSQQLPAEFINPEGCTREVFDKKISDLLRQYHVELIVLIGYMRILSPYFISQWENKIINVHPSLLPLHAGKMDMDVHRAVLAAKEKETGCSVHYVTEEVDAGPVIVQKKCAVLPEDTAENLKQRVQQLEAAALVEAIVKII